MAEKRLRTKRIDFDQYDTQKLEEARKILNKVYEYNYDHSHKEILLLTVITKLDRIIADFGEHEVDPESRGY